MDEDQEREMQATLPGVKTPSRQPPPRPQPPRQAEAPSSRAELPDPEQSEEAPRPRGILGRAQQAASRAQSRRRLEEPPAPDSPGRQRRVTVTRTSSGEFSELSEDEINTIEGATAAAIVIVTRLVDWLANKTICRARPRDLVATGNEARRLGRPLARFLVNHVEVDGLSVLEKRDLIRGGIAGGAYGGRVLAGNPGGKGDPAEADRIIDQALTDR